MAQPAKLCAVFNTTLMDDFVGDGALIKSERVIGLFPEIRKA